MPRPTTTGVFHQYLEMIGSTEPMTKKAGFWCSYVRGLGGIIPRRIYLRCLAIERTNSRVFFSFIHSVLCYKCDSGRKFRKISHMKKCLFNNFFRVPIHMRDDTFQKTIFS